MSLHGSPTTRTSPLLEPLAGGQPEFRPALRTVESVLREARRVMGELGHHCPQRKLVRLVRSYLGSGNAQDLGFRAWVLTYADPTGEQAVHNVTRERHDG